MLLKMGMRMRMNKKKKIKKQNFMTKETKVIFAFMILLL